MSRRPPNPAAERAARNSKIIKDLLKLEPNKLCADCKRNKHPRWASWNLGVFVCIRCSGIHRGMGTHISRVKSVDLDSWTDEQLNSIVSWGNARAKKYWEAKLSPDHVPSEAKIENFIRTKYELKRWTMDGPIPDPSTLDDDDDDDVPLAVVKEKQQLEKSAPAAAPPQSGRPIAGPIAAPAADLIGGVDDPVPARASSGPPAQQRVPPRADAAPPKATTPASKDSLLGLDFFQPAAPPRPASTTGSASAAGGGQSRPDLKQSILSLYASAPKPKPQQQQQQQQPPTPGSNMFGSMPSPTGASASLGGLNDAFGGLNFSAQPAQPPKPVDPFAGLGSASLHSPKVSQSSKSSGAFGLSGGSFFDTKPAQAVPRQGQSASTNSFGDFGSFSSPTASASQPAAQPASSSAFGDLFGLSSSTAAPTTALPVPQSQPAAAPSVFNLSSTASAAPAAAPATTSNSAWASIDGWDNNAWNTSDKSPNPGTTPVKSTNDFGWGSSSATTTTTATSSIGGMGSLAAQSIVPGASGFTAAPKVAADEEFGGWARSAAPVGKAVGGFGGTDDLFSNVWQ